MTFTTLGLAADSSGVAAAIPDLDKLTASATNAEAAAKRLASGATQASGALHDTARASNDEAQAATRATASARLHTAALEAEAAAARMSSFHQRNLMFQMTDMAQGIPLLFQSPGYGLMNIANQFSQIGQSYYGQGGMGAALKDMASMAGGMVAKFAPVLAVVGAVTIGVAALRDEINRTYHSSVTFGDVTAAAMDMAYDRMMGLADGLLKYLGKSWEQVGGFARDAFNFIARGFDQMIADVQKESAMIGALWGASVETAKAAWGQLPGALGDIMIQTAQNVVNGVKGMINSGLHMINDMLAKLPSWVPGGGTTVKDVDFPPINNPFVGQQLAYQKRQAAINASLGASMVSANNAYDRRMTEINGTDYFGALATRAIDLHGKGEDTVGKTTGKVRDLADRGIGYLTEKTNAFADAFKSAFSGLGSGLLNAVKQGGDVAGNILDMLGNKLTDFAGRLLDNTLNQGVGMLADALFPAANPLMSALGAAGGVGIPHFAGGGRGQVPYRGGGTDTTLFIARATPGEDFAFGQQARGGKEAPVMHVTNHYTIAGTVTDREVAAMVQRGMGAAVETVKRSIPEWQVNMQTNGAM